ncbi:hypothetical protein DIPPA_24996 [Diplonema papillatum]|nr:hypothetical protein DIPPA_24996 [Diplonema papillatum]
MSGRKRTKADGGKKAAKRGADSYALQVVSELDTEDLDFNAAVLAFKSGADLSLQEDKLHALAVALDSQTNVTLDETTLDALFHSLTSLDKEEKADLQGSPNAPRFAALLYGLLQGDVTPVTFKSGLVYFTLLLCFGSNASRVFNGFFARRLLSLGSQFLSSKAASAKEEDPAAAECSQASIRMTPDVTASQYPHVPASQKPAKRRKTAKGPAKKDAPDDHWQTTYAALVDLLGLFENPGLLRVLPRDLSGAVAEALAALPLKEVGGWLHLAHGTGKAGGSPLQKKCFSALQKLLADNAEVEIYELHTAAGDAAGDDEEGSVRSASVQEVVLPLLIPYVHLAAFYAHTAVKLPEALALQNEALALIRGAAVLPQNSALFLKLVLSNGEKRPRAEPLVAAARAAVRLLEELDAAGKSAVLEYAESVANSDRVHHRLFAAEFAFAVLQNSAVMRELGVDAVQPVVKYFFDGINDTAAIVRTRALGNLSKTFQAIGSTESIARPAVSAFLTNLRTETLPKELTESDGQKSTVRGGNTEPDTPAAASSAASPEQTPRVSNISTSPAHAAIPATKMNYLVASVVARTREEKALVRKAAIDLLLQFFEHKVIEAAPLLSTIFELMDVKMEPSVLVRRQAVLCAWTIVLTYPDITIRSKVMGSILQRYPVETEDFVLKAMLNAVEILIIAPLTGAQSDLKEDDVWQLTASLTDAQLASLGKICCKLVETGEISASIVKTLVKRVDQLPDSRDAWAIFPVIARKYRKKVNVDVIVKCFDLMKQRVDRGSITDHTVLQHVLSLLPILELPEEVAARVRGEIEAMLLALTCHPNVSAALVACLAALSTRKRYNRLCHVFVGLGESMLYNLLTESTAKPVPALAQASGITQVSLSELPVVICIAGCLLANDSPTTHKPDHETDANIDATNQLEAVCVSGRSKLEAKPDLCTLAELIAAVCNAACVKSKDGASGRLSTDSVGDLQREVDRVQKCKDLPEPVVRHVFLCQARLCLHAKSACRKGVPLLLRGLRAGSLAVRTTCANGLADLSVKYPGMIDKFLPNMSALLSDPEVVVRFTAATLIAQLLGESFLKMRPFLFFEMLSLVADVSAALSSFARHTILKVMAPKDPYLMTNHFQEVLFVLNNYVYHPKFNKQTAPVVKLIGEDKRSLRVQLLRFIAGHVVTEKEILRIHEQLHDVLDMCSADGSDGVTLNVSCSEGMSLFRDAIHVLLSPELNLINRTLDATQTASSAAKQKGEEAAADVEDEEAEAAMRKALWAGVVKTRVRDMVCPLLSSVSVHLRKQRSPLQKELVHYAAYVMQDYEAEVSSYVPDEQLRKDILSTLADSRKSRGRSRFGTAMPPPSLPATPRRSTSMPSHRATTPRAPPGTPAHKQSDTIQCP